jgi:acetyl esterase
MGVSEKSCFLMSALDPDLAAYFASLGTLFPPLPADPTPLERRARHWALVGLGRTPLPSNVTMNDVQLDLASGKVGVRLFYGHDGADEPVPTIIYFHGGGWVVGDADTHTSPAPASRTRRTRWWSAWITAGTRSTLAHHH